MKPMIIPSSGFHTVEPAFTSDGEVRLVLRAVVAFAPEWNDAGEIVSVQPLTADWDGIEHQEQMIKRPDNLFIDRRNMVGDREAAIERFRDYRRRRLRDGRPSTQRPGHRVCRYRPAALLDRLDRD
jgi:hypothetical protein